MKNLKIKYQVTIWDVAGMLRKRNYCQNIGNSALRNSPLSTINSPLYFPLWLAKIKIFYYFFPSSLYFCEKWVIWEKIFL
jgi:hypothetical protein